MSVVDNIRNLVDETLLMRVKQMLKEATLHQPEDEKEAKETAQRVEEHVLEVEADTDGYAPTQKLAKRSSDDSGYGNSTVLGLPTEV